MIIRNKSIVAFQQFQKCISCFTPKAVSEELDKHYYSKERLRWSTQTAEQNSIVMLDAINTLLFMFDAETLIPADNAPHKVITQSKHMMKEKIAHFKQMSDDRKRRKAEKMNSK